MDFLDHWLRSVSWWMFIFVGCAAQQFSPEELFNIPAPPDFSRAAVLKPQQQQQQQQDIFLNPPRFAGNNLQRCEDIRRERPEDTLSIVRQEGLISAVEDVSFRRNLFSTIIIGTSSVHFGCAPKQDVTNCSRNACYNLRYRTMDGSCNNFVHPFLGAAATPYIRYHPANYDDGVSAVTASINNKRPSARDITKNVLSSGQTPAQTHPTYNSLVMQFGQFLAHDISKTAMLPRSKCETCQELRSHCAPIPILNHDPAYACPQLPCCLLFTRAAPVCGSGFNSDNPRQQLNENTAFIDASAVYGSSVPDRDRLRDGIFMKTTFFNDTGYLPFDKGQCTGANDCNVTFDAGDSRFVIFIGLAAFHTVLLREHNRLAEGLLRINPQWTTDRVYQEARKILGAELQVITYKEWLPKILGHTHAHYVGTYDGYKPDVDPSITAEFTYAGMRFGHGMIVEEYDRLNASDQSIPQGSMKFEEGVLRPQKLLFEGGIEALMRGMLRRPVKRPQRISPLVTTRLFGSQDLASISLQRGRDAGISSYNDMREFCGLGRALTFEEVRDEIKDPALRENLREGFGSPDAMDLYVGALVEDPIPGAMVGPTLACILGDQFKRIRDGDRFWYENPNVFLHKQLVELDKVSIARLLCDNMIDFHEAPRDGFELPTEINVAKCKDIPSMDLEKWFE